jgi:UDPglucose 6-dehydrogenase
LIHLLLQQNAKIVVFDEEAMENTRNIFGDKIEYATDMYSCLDSADGLIICTEWISFRTPDINILKTNLNQKIIFDGRNLFQPEDMRQLGFEYFCVGRS